MRARHSLRYKLPLLISALLCLVVGALGWSAYRQLETVLLQTAGRRLRVVSEQLSGMLTQSLDRTRRSTATLARDPAFATLLAHPADSAARDAAQRLLEHARDRERAASASRDTEPVSFAVWNAGGERLLVAGPPTDAMAVAPQSVPTRQSLGEPAAVVGPLVASRSRVALDIVAPLARADGPTEGYLVAYRVITHEGVEQINKLIGSDAGFLVGNTRGDVWTDLAHAVSGPPAGLRHDSATEFAGPDGERTLGVMTQVRSTPWLLWVGIPRRSLLAPARSFLDRLAIGAFTLIVLGALGAWFMSLRVTVPLAEISGAAEDVARGDYTRRVEAGGDDELGSLARSFNLMAAQVQAATDRLHAQTAALTSANVEMRESERRYRQLVDFSPDAVIVHRDREILFANPAAVGMYGAASPGQVIGRSLLDFTPAADRDGLTARVQRCQVDQQPIPFAERRVLRLDGSLRSVETTSAPFILDGRPSVLTILRDISERKRLEDQVRQAHRMEAVGQLAGGIAHDFNNVVMAIRSYGEFVLESLDAGDARREDVGEILKASTRATTLTRQLLAFSRQQMLQPRAFDLNATVADLAPMLGRLVGSDMQLESRLDPALGAAHADPGQIEQVLVNLVVNARDAMPDGGSITVQTSNADVGEGCGRADDTPPGRYVVLAVSDSGCGMDAATKARIFEPFFTTKPVGQGTGLGLSTVYGIVRQSGGCVSVYSEPGLGTTIKVYLPRVDVGVAPADRSAEPIATRSPRTGTILVVEDEPALRSVMRRILAKRGYTVVEASNGAEALALVASAKAPIDLVITDLVMPEMGGRALATELHARWPDTPLLFVSGFTRDAATRRHVLAPGAGFLEKPFTPDALAAAVEEALQGATSAGAV